MTEPDALERRLSVAQTARYLGATPRHVQKLIRAGVLPAWDIRSPGSQRARYSVSESSVRKLLADSFRVKRTERTERA